MSLKKLLKESVKAARKKNKGKTNGGWSYAIDMPAGVRFDKQGEPILPKTDGQCVDLLYELREARLSAQRQLERYEKFESKLKERFINTLDIRDSTGCAGRLARVQIEFRVVPQVEDWQAFYAYVQKHQAWELFQRRLNESAVKEHWDEREQIPGVVAFNAKKVSCVKL